MDKPKVTIKATVQSRHFGVKRPRTSGSSLDTASASFMKKSLVQEGFSFEPSVTEATHKESSSSTKTTYTFSMETTSEVAIAFLNKVDAKSETPDYTVARKKYLDAKEASSDKFGGTLDGRGKLEYYNTLKPYAFDYYNIQYSITIEFEESRKVIHSKVHHRLNAISQSEFEDQIKKLQDLAASGSLGLVKAISANSTETADAAQDNNEAPSPNDN